MSRQDTGSRDIRNYSICLAATANAVRNNNCVDDDSKTTFEFSEDQDGDTSDTNYQYTLTGLTNGTAYYVGVAVRNGVSRTAFGTFPGVSVYTLYQESGSDATLTPTAPAADRPTLVRALRSDTVDRVVVSWQAPTTAPDGYEVCVLTESRGTDFDADCIAGRFAVAAAAATSLEVYNDLRTVDVNANDFRLSGIQDSVVNNIAVRSYTGDGSARVYSDWIASATNPLGIRAAATPLPMLTALTIHTGADATTPALTTSPTFASRVQSDGGTNGISVFPRVAIDTTEVTLAWTATAGATVRNGGTADTFPEIMSPETFTLNADSSTTITLGITGEGGSHIFTITILKAEPDVANDDATLAELSLSGVTLNENFVAGVTAYTTEVGGAVTTVTVTATASDSDDATVTVNGGASPQDIPLRVGANTISIVVTAENGDRQTYTVTVTRAEPGTVDQFTFTDQIGTAAPEMDITQRHRLPSPAWMTVLVRVLR